jgi:hypothetical protein
MSASFFQPFLYGYVFWVCVSLGCFGLMLLHHMLRGTWGLPILRLVEAGAKTLYVMLPLFLLLYVGREYIYPWMDPQLVATDKVLHLKSAYLNSTGFLVRGLVYFAIWIGLTFILTRSSKRQDETGDHREAQMRTNLSAPGFVLFILTVTFAFTDWVMSVDAHWYSTIFGAWFVISQGLSAMSLCVFWLTSRVKQDPYSQIVTPKLTRDHGNLLLMMTMVWAYFTFSQFLIIWSGNLPEETEFFKHRMEGAWNYMGSAIVLFQFFIPFVLLLSGRTKRTPDILRNVAVIIFCTRIVDLYWHIAPFFVKDTHHTGPVQAAGPFLLAFAGVGVLWIAAFEFFRRQSSILPTHDPRLVITSGAPMEAAHHA